MHVTRSTNGYLKLLKYKTKMFDTLYNSLKSFCDMQCQLLELTM